MESVGDENLAKRSDVQKVQEYVRRGRPRIRWKDCVKRDVERVRRIANKVNNNNNNNNNNSSSNNNNRQQTDGVDNCL